VRDGVPKKRPGAHHERQEVKWLGRKHRDEVGGRRGRQRSKEKKQSAEHVRRADAAPGSGPRQGPPPKIGGLEIRPDAFGRLGCHPRFAAYEDSLGQTAGGQPLPLVGTQREGMRAGRDEIESVRGLSLQRGSSGTPLGGCNVEGWKRSFVLISGGGRFWMMASPCFRKLRVLSSRDMGCKGGDGGAGRRRGSVSRLDSFSVLPQRV